MTAEVHTVSENAPLDEVVAIMERNHIKRVPVMYREKVVGIVTRADILRALIDGTKPRLSSADDITIRGQLLSHLAQQGGLRSGLLMSRYAMVSSRFPGSLPMKENAERYVLRQKTFRALKGLRISSPGWYLELE
jgi:CBS domain-containing protein